MCCREMVNLGGNSVSEFQKYTLKLLNNILIILYYVNMSLSFNPHT